MTVRELAGWLSISKSRAKEFAAIWEGQYMQSAGEGMARIQNSQSGITLPSGAVVKHDSTSGYMAHIPEGRS